MASTHGKCQFVVDRDVGLISVQGWDPLCLEAKKTGTETIEANLQQIQ